MADEKEILKPEAFAGLKGWRIEDGFLQKSFAVKPYFKALGFVNQIGWLAQMQNHHPDVTLSWGQVNVRMISHDVGGLTSRDLALAKAIEALPRDF